MELEPIINRIANSQLITLDIEEHLDKGERVTIDLKDALQGEHVLREKPFRQFVMDHDWSQYLGKNVLLTSSEDIIIPEPGFLGGLGQNQGGLSRYPDCPRPRSPISVQHDTRVMQNANQDIIRFRQQNVLRVFS